jgi:lantibiotic transport system ATP-binding protein
VTDADQAALAIHTCELTRTFGERRAVDSLALRVPCGSIFAFLGPNGAGKTTTIRLLLGLIRPTHGSVLLLGSPLTWHQRDVLRSVGSLVEAPALYPHLTGWENLEVARRILDLPVESLGKALDLAGLTTDADRLVGAYSQGMRQRLGLALAWLGEPRLLILDEPTNGLDPTGTRQLREILRRFVREDGMTVFLSSHILSEVEQVADQVAIVHEGRLLFQGDLSDLRREHPQGSTLEDVFVRLVSTPVTPLGS